MKRWKKFTALMILIAFSVMMLFGCASQMAEKDTGNSAGYAGAPREATSSETAKGAAPAPVISKDSTAQSNPLDLGYNIAADRKVVRSAQISMETAEYDTDKAAILSLLERVGGYVQYAAEWGNKPEDYKDKGRTAQYTFRIPQASFANFLSELDKIGTQLERTMGGEDITSQYTDVETRLKTQRTKLERLEKLLDDATKMEDIITLENAISDTTLQIEQYTASLNNWDNLVAEATVGVYMTEVVKVDAFEGVKDETFGDKISNAFNSAIAGIIDGVKWLVVTIVSILPALIVLGVITAVIVVPIIITQRRKRKKMKAAMEARQNMNQNGNQNIT
ncbi:MAG: DUF4349 domain-containing protein [Christensenellales bacterium]